MQSIHPAFLSADHIGAIVRWEKGDTVIQGRLDDVQHRTESVVQRATSPSCQIVTRVWVEGAEPILVRVDDDRARLTIIREAGA